MDLLISIAARDRFFAKALRPLLAEFKNLSVEFAAITLVHPIHEAMLIGLTDGRPPGSLEMISNRDGYFQALAGIQWPATQEELKTSVTAIICEAVHRCPFSQSDRRHFIELLARHA